MQMSQSLKAGSSLSSLSFPASSSLSLYPGIFVCKEIVNLRTSAATVLSMFDDMHTHTHTHTHRAGAREREEYITIIYTLRPVFESALLC